MKRVIHHIRLQPKKVRMTLAFFAAGIITLIIAFFWIASWATHPQEITTEKTPDPLESLTDNIKGAFEETKPTSLTPNTQGENTVQIINQGDTSSFDESLPAASLSTQ